MAGTTVLDFTQFLSGPYGTQLLADLGAEVVKVEPLVGDSSRTIRSHLINGSSGYFASINRSKRSLAIDLKTPEGRDAALRLIANADLAFENFRPGTMDRLGLGYDVLRAKNPRLVLCSITGFGQQGPLRGRQAYDVVIQAMSGGMSLTGPLGGEPVRSGIPIADLAAGMCGVIGALAALHEAEQTGEGRHVDVSMLDVQLSMLTYQATYYLISGQVPGTQGRDHVSIPTYRSFRCADGRDIIVAANTEQMWHSLCDALSCPRLSEDPRFTTNELRQENRDVLNSLLEPRFATRTSADWDRILAEHDVPAAPLNDVASALASGHVSERGLILRLPDERGDPVPTVGCPVRMVGPEPRSPDRPPRLGEHSRHVLGTMAGFDAATITGLIARGIVRDGATPQES